MARQSLTAIGKVQPKGEERQKLPKNRGRYSRTTSIDRKIDIIQLTRTSILGSNLISNSKAAICADSNQHDH